MADFTEQHYEFQVKESDFFKAPSNLFESCMFCGLTILPGEVICEPRESEYCHEDCLPTED